MKNNDDMSEINLIKAVEFSPESIQFPPSWVGHIPFIAWFIRELSPKIFVELGTHTGNSYFAACQSVKESKLPTNCFAVDTWRGDEHTGNYTEEIFNQVTTYNKEKYENFSKLMRMKFDEALPYFSDNSIELLHIDGLHSYEAVSHDFKTWLPKMAPESIIIFHDTKVTEKGFGVWKLWSELIKEYPYNLEFDHSNGLGVIMLSNKCKAQFLNEFFSKKDKFKNYFSSLGGLILSRYKFNELKQQIVVKEQALAAQIAERDAIIIERDAQIAAIYRTYCWRISSPLRFIGRLIKFFLQKS